MMPYHADYDAMMDNQEAAIRDEILHDIWLCHQRIERNHMDAYIHQLIKVLCEKYEPDEVDARFPNQEREFERVYSQDQEQTPMGWGLRFGNLIVSIQCSAYNYCDFYSAINGEHSFYHGHPHTRTAEIAVIEATSQRRFVRWEDGDMVRAYVSASAIEEIVKTVAEYTGRVIQ